MAGLTDRSAEAETLMGTGEEAIVGLENHKKCSDYSQHGKWNPMKSFNRNSLPDSFQHGSVERLIRIKSRSTVRITRQKTSAHRPPEFKYDSEKIPCGSGTFFYSDDLQESQCFLPECAKKKPHRAVVNIQIVTAPHVIWDDSEAKSAIFDFFFDAQDREGVIEAHGFRIKKFEKDSPPYCIIECVCHDLSLLGKLKEDHRSCQNLMEEIQRSASKPVKGKNLLVFIAHPHGLAKHFAFGELKGKPKKDSCTADLSPSCRITQCCLKYLSPGCPGSGGGQLMEVGRDGSYVTFALHMGKERNGERTSGLGWTAE